MTLSIVVPVPPRTGLALAAWACRCRRPRRPAASQVASCGNSPYRSRPERIADRHAHEALRPGDPGRRHGAELRRLPGFDPGSVPKGVPAVYTDAAKSGKTSGPHHLDAVVQGKLDQDLSQYGKVAMHTPNGTYLVKPLASVFSNAAGGSSTGQAWLATRGHRRVEIVNLVDDPDDQAQTLTPPAASTTTAAPTSYGPNYVVRDLPNLLRLRRASSRTSTSRPSIA